MEHIKKKYLLHQVHDLLDVELELPGGYATSRRAALKAVALAGGLGSVYVLLTRAKVCAHILIACMDLPLCMTLLLLLFISYGKVLCSTR